jgi:hypothetical protein
MQVLYRNTAKGSLPTQPTNLTANTITVERPRRIERERHEKHKKHENQLILIVKFLDPLKVANNSISIRNSCVLW